MAEVILFDLAFSSSLGLRSLKEALIKKGISCEIIDLTKEIRKGYSHVRQNYYTLPNRKKAVQAVVKRLKKENAKIESAQFLGFTFISNPDEAATRVPISRYLKDLYPSKIQIGGGPGITSDAKKFMQESRLDYALKGEAEKTLPELILAIKNKRKVSKIKGIVYRTKRGIVETKKVALLNREEAHKLPFVHVKSETKGMVNTYAERGCPNACVFCSVPRKGNPVAISEDTIIEGILKLAKNKTIKEIRFVDDQLFANKERAIRILKKLNELGLNKRFIFGGMATVDSLMKNGQIDKEFIDLIRATNFKYIWMGTESLSNNILREIKSGRYTAQEAIKVADYLKIQEIKVGNFMLAGGIETRARDFIESYYNSMSRYFKTKSSYTPLGIIESMGKSGLLEKARKERLIFNAEGKRINPSKTGLTENQFIMPKDPLLRELFLKQIKERKATLGLEELPSIIELSRKAEERKQGRKTMTRKLLKLQGELQSFVQTRGNTATFFLRQAVFGEAKKRFGNINQENVDKVVKDRTFFDRARIEAQKKGEEYLRANAKINQLEGIERVREMQKARQRFQRSGFIIPYRRTAKR
jgi:hypothetical protein